MTLPFTFVEKMKAMLAGEYEDYIACYKEKRLYGLRVNTGKISVERFKEIIPFKVVEIPWIKNGFYYDGEQVQPAKHPYYFAGLYYLQEPSAMTPANRLHIQQGDKVLDICAAPGGKATELGAKLQREGILVANDISNSRAKGLLKNIELFGIGNVMVLSEDPLKLQHHFVNYFDKILIDAPCSGEGMFRKDSKMVKSWEERGPEYFASIQRDIIIAAANMLKPGGIMLYSTCTFDPQENESTIEFLLETYPEFEVIKIDPYKGFEEGKPEYTKTKIEAIRNTVRIWPHKMTGEGHYLALLQKKESKENQELKSDFPRTSHNTKIDKLPEEFKEFFSGISWKLDDTCLEIQGENIYYMPTGLPNMKGLRFLRTGLLLGETKKKRFEPSQALALYLKMEEYKHVINLTLIDNRVIRYLKGETLDISDLTTPKDKGWYLICVDGFPLGWGKVMNQTLKNKYLPGWRWQS